MSGPAPAVLDLQQVSKTRGTGRLAVQALTGVSLAVDAGEFVLVEGPSGSGKTTLLAIAAGLLGATSGVVMLAGETLGALSPSARRRLRATKVGFVYQRANLLAGLTARENVMMAAAVAGMPADESARETDGLLADLGIAALASRRPGELSGGEEQRVAVARALVHRPRIVFADEPTASLDGVAGHAVAERLRDLARDRGAAVVVATHDDRLHAFSTRRIRVVDGKVN